MRVFQAEKVFNTRQDLIKYAGDRWIGPLAEEPPGIINFSAESVDLYLINMDEKVPSLSVSTKESAGEINHLIRWIRDDVVLGEGAFIGFKAEEGPKI